MQQINTYCHASSTEAAGVCSSWRIPGTLAPNTTDSTRENTPKAVRVVPMARSTRWVSPRPVYLATSTVPPKVRPESKLVIVWVTCVPVETAAPLSAGQ